MLHLIGLLFNFESKNCLKMSKQFSETHAVDGLSKFTIGIYGTGHVFNDLAAACWFNYLLYYLTEVLEIGSAAAGGVLFAG